MTDRASEQTQWFGDYLLLERIGRGGMGAVYKALNKGDDSLVAVKIANQRSAMDPVLRARFENECQFSCEFHHARLVRALDHGIVNGLPYLTMEYVPGKPLNRLIQERGRLTESEAVSIVLQVSEALTYLHEKQCIHRDVKPENILVTPENTVKLADLGLIKDLESNKELTKSMMGLGTFEYSAPEQYDDARSADPRSDVYSLAATMYGALTGLFPFGSGGHMTVLGRKLNNEFDAPRKVVPELSERVNSAICRALQARREDRPATIGEFTRLLRGDGSANLAAAPSSEARRKRRAIDKDDRRSKVRYAVELVSSCEPIPHNRREPWRATLQDVSLGGMCLRMQRRFEAGTVLRVAIDGLGEDAMGQHLVRVCWVKEHSPRVWLLGCSLAQPLSENELDDICFEGGKKTSMRVAEYPVSNTQLQ